MLATLLTSSLILSTTVNAATSLEVPKKCDTRSSFFLFPTWYEYLEIGDYRGDECAIKGPQTDGQLDWGLAIPRIGLAVVEILLRIAGLVAVVYVVMGGFKYMTSQGEPENLKQAQGTIINALIGLVIAMLATAVVNVIGVLLWK